MGRAVSQWCDLNNFVSLGGPCAGRVSGSGAWGEGRAVSSGRPWRCCESISAARELVRGARWIAECRSAERVRGCDPQ